jgi:uncharacterized DUF497 family protein
MILFEWDEAKAESNRRKHGIDFDDAIEAFYDPHSIMEQDRVVDGELRWQTIGLVGDAAIVLVAHTVDEHGQEEVIRIVSARLADRKERRRYGQNR